jgi:gluconate:H+ symporter, GntP family
MLSPLLAAASFDTWPFVVLVISVAAVVIGISVVKLHPFLALIIAALLAGVIADTLPADPKSPEKGQWVRAVELTTEGFGKTAGGISIIIGMATIIGMALMESGAADKVVRRFLAVCGTKPAGISFAIVVSTYVLSIPIFFDSMFMLMVPIAVAMALRTGRDFTLYVCAICAGGVVTHALTVPHPGPIYMAENLGIDVGLSIWVGIAAGAVPMLAGWGACQWLNKKFPVELRETPTLPLHDARAMMEKPESSLPGFIPSLLPIIVPIFLISLASVFEVVKQTHAKDAQSWAGGWINAFGGTDGFFRFKGYIDFIGNKNIALVIGAVLALWLLVRQRKLSLATISKMTGPPLETAGVIILITAAGGAFGYMLTQAGVGNALAGWAKSTQGINLVLLGYLVSVVFRVAQGSATVAMQTTSAMFIALLPSLGCHPLYLFLAIGFGATGFSWMNDSGFWVVSRLSGFTEKETLKTWSLLLTIISIVGIVLTLVASKMMPFVG